MDGWRTIVSGIMALVALATTGHVTPALADKLVALVIGNSAYQHVARLANPANDAGAMTEMLRKAGFDVVESQRDLTASEMRRTLRDFADQARDADIALVYFAGHGIEVDGNNYLIPVDAVLERDLDIYDEAFALDRILVTVEPARQLRLVILDACRDNPFAKSMKRTIGSRAISRGLAKVEPTLPNTLVAFASKAGSTASDGDSRHSPFTAALIKHIAKPGLDLRRAFGFVRDDVLKSTSNRQEPYVYGSLGGDDLPLVPAKTEAVGPQSSPQDAVRRDYELALQLGTRDGWTAFLARYADGFYADLARGQLAKISAEEARQAATEKARQAETEKNRLTAERAKQAEQDKAATAARVAEDERLAAERAKAAQEAKAAAAEQRRKEIEAAVAKALAERATADKALADKRSSDDAVHKPDQTAQPGSEQKLTALAPPSMAPASNPQEISKSLQAELRRVGCLSGEPEAEWSTAARRSLKRFNQHAGTRFDVEVASADALDVVKAKPSRVCPPLCQHGFRADGDRCVRIACRRGYQVNDDNECERIPQRKPAEARELVRPRDAERRTEPSRAAKPQSSGEIFCNSAGCRPVPPGCHLQRTEGRAPTTEGINGGLREVCN